MRVGFRVKIGLLLVLTGLLAIGSAAQTQVPAAPAGFTATPGNGQVSLSWSAVTAATSYHLKRATISGGPYTQIAAPWYHSYTDVSRTNGVTYFYVVSAVSAAGDSANSAQVSAKPSASAQPQGPAAPAGFTATPGNGQVSLTWSAVTAATSYHLKRATTSGGPYTQIAAPGYHSYTDVSRTNGVTYFYVVSAVSAAGESGNSSQVSAKPASSPTVTSVTISPTTASAVTSGTLPFTATVQGTTSNKAVTWKAALGKITASGNYTAPATAGTDTVTATSSADPTKSASTSVKVTTAPSPSPAVTSVTISPTTASSITSGTLPFTATVQGTTSNKAVTWKAALGKITSSGNYTAPATAGTDTVTATSSADPTKSMSASVKVTTAPANPPPSPAPPPPTTPTSSGLPIAFFSQSLRDIAASHFPTVPFGSLRLCDTNTTWPQIEISRGNYDWQELDMWAEWGHSHGKDLMFTFGRVPLWAGPARALAPSDIASGDTQWKEFVTAVVKHSLASPEHYIAFYEMWNEPDLKSNWAGTPAQLVTMAKDAYAIIHALDPKAKLVGPSPTTANQWGVHFLPDYYAAGGAVPQDIVGMHAYLYDGPYFSTSPANITLSISQVKALMAKYGISNKPIWYTEGNWNGSGTQTLTDAQEAAYLAQEYMLIWSTDAVSRYYWYSWDNLKIGQLWDETKGIHPAGTAYGLLAEWLIGSTHSANPCSTGSDGTWTCALTLSTEYPAEIVWNASTSKTITVDASFATYETLSNTTVHSIAAHQVPIGPLPVLIIKSQTNQ